MKYIKGFIVFVILLSFSLLIIGCNKDNNDNKDDDIKTEPTITGINIVSYPEKLEYYYDEEFDPTGIEVECEYSDGSRKECLDYKIYNVEFSKDNLGKYLIDVVLTINNKEYSASFFVNVKDYERIEVDSHSDYSDKTILNIPFNAYDEVFNDIQRGGFRNSDTLVIYDEDCLVKTNVYGYEVAIDKYGCVIDKNVNVTLPEGGYILSGIGTRSSDVKKIEIGDYILFNQSVFLYKKDSVNVNNNQNVFLDFLNKIDLLNTINDNKEFNELVSKINNLIPDMEKLYKGEEVDIDSINDRLDDIKFESLASIESLDKYEHKYSLSNDIDFRLLSADVDKELMSYQKIDSYNDTLYYGGFRNTDTLVYYDNGEYYRSRNEYGYEIAIVNGIVIDKDILVDIPEDGFILSGHGKASKFIKEKVFIGDKIEIKDDEVYVYRDINTDNFKKYINKRNEVYRWLSNELVNEVPHDYEYIVSLLKEADSLFKTIKFDESIGAILLNSKEFNRIDRLIGIIASQLGSNDPNKERGLWYRPFSISGLDDSIDHVKETLLKIKNMGINEVLIDIYKNKYALFNNSYNKVYPDLESYDYGEYGHDYLKCFISEAHKLGIFVTAFTQNFSERIDTLIESHPEYYQINYQGERSKGNIYYYDICNDNVQNMSYGIYSELVSLYDFDGIEYDIIRYPASTLYRYLDIDEIPSKTKIEDDGYTEYSMNKFMTKYNYSGDLKELIRTNKQVRIDWLKFKKDELDNYVKTLSETIRAIKSDIVISAAILSNYTSATKSHLQDGIMWINEGYIDKAEPMFYTGDMNEFNAKFENYFDKGVDEHLRVGLSVKLYSFDNYLEFYQMDKACNYRGFIFFSSKEYLNDNYFDKMMMKSYHYDYISNLNSEEEIIRARIDNVIDMVKNFYSELNDVSYNSLITNLEKYDILLARKLISQLNDKAMSEYLLGLLK